MKFLSRKFLVFILNFIGFVVLAYFGKLTIEVVIALLLNSVIYLFIEGMLDLKKIKFTNAFFNIEAANENQKSNVSNGS